MGCTLLGICLLAYAPNFLMLLAGASLLGLGASIFHPEASRLARLASGGAHGMAQSLFHVGGALGSAVGAALTAWRNRCSSSAAPSAARSGRYWRPLSSCRTGRAVSPGSPSWRSGR